MSGGKNLKRLVSLAVCAALVVTLTACSKNEESSSGNGDSSPSSSAANTAAGLEIPEFAKFNALMLNKDYTIQVREPEAAWQDIKAYSVRINNNRTQNIAADDPVKLSPMLYFGMGSKPVEISLQKAEGAIESAEVLPASAGITARVEGGRAYFTVSSPQNLCVRINGERYELVYVFANPADTARPTESTEEVVVVPPGRTNGDMLGENAWNGAIRDVRIYSRSLSAAEVGTLKTGGQLPGYTYRWKLDSGFAEESGAGTDQQSVLGEPAFEAAYQGAAAGSMVLTGRGESFGTGVSQGKENLDAYSISAWVYRHNALNTHTILQELLYVEPDGTICSNIGDWQHPYESDNKLAVGKWQLVTLVKNGSDVTVYIDGASGGTKTRPDQESPYGITIGSAGRVRGIYLQDNQTFYLSPGAVYHGTVMANGVKNVKIAGSGIIDITPEGGSQTCYNGIIISHSENVTVEGIIVSNPRFFSVRTLESKDVTWRNVKIFSSYGPSDGCNIVGSEKVTVDGCFIRSNDDGVSISGGAKDITIQNSSIIDDVAHAFFISNANTVTAENIDILDSKQFGAGYQGVLGVCADNGAVTENIRFNNIRIGDIRNNDLFYVAVQYDYSYSLVPGQAVKNVTFSNITYTGTGFELSTIQGYADDRRVDGVHFENVVINGSKLTGADGEILAVGPFADNITFS